MSIFLTIIFLLFVFIVLIPINLFMILGFVWRMRIERRMENDELRKDEWKLI